MPPVPQPPPATEWKFIQELQRPLWERPLRWRRRPRRRSEASLRRGVAVRKRFADPSGMLDTAFADLDDFLKAAGIGQAGSYELALGLAPGRGQEAYRLDVAANRCEILAGDLEGAASGGLLPGGRTAPGRRSLPAPWDDRAATASPHPRLPELFRTACPAWGQSPATPVERRRLLPRRFTKPPGARGGERAVAADQFRRPLPLRRRARAGPGRRRPRRRPPPQHRRPLRPPWDQGLPLRHRAALPDGRQRGGEGPSRTTRPEDGDLRTRHFPLLLHQQPHRFGLPGGGHARPVHQRPRTGWPDQHLRRRGRHPLPLRLGRGRHLPPLRRTPALGGAQRHPGGDGARDARRQPRRRADRLALHPVRGLGRRPDHQRRRTPPPGGRPPPQLRVRRGCQAMRPPHAALGLLALLGRPEPAFPRLRPGDGPERHPGLRQAPGGLQPRGGHSVPFVPVPAASSTGNTGRSIGWASPGSCSAGTSATAPAP